MASLIIAFITIVLSFVSAFGMSSHKPEFAPLPSFNREVPVLLARGEEFVIQINGSSALECYRGIKLAEVYYFTSDFKLIYNDDGIEVQDENGMLTIGLTEVRCKPRNEMTFPAFKGKSYRGYLRGVYSDKNDDMMLLNMIDLEDYLAGVLPAEIGERTENEYEAARAQAVAARTYAVWKLTNSGPDGTLFPTVADQVYSGKDSEKPMLTKAVAETSGEILVYNDLPIAAYYHAVCGGQTIPLEKAWPEKNPVPYLHGVNDDDYCAWAKTYKWSETFDLPALKANLIKYFIDRQIAVPEDFETILDIDFTKDESVGRMASMEITTGTRVLMVERDQIRWALGRPSVPGAILPSTKFEYEKTRTQDGVTGLKINGFGNGHGVGVCQCGAIGRARDGQDYQKILKSYYKGAKIKRIY